VYLDAEKGIWRRQTKSIEPDISLNLQPSEKPRGQDALSIQRTNIEGVIGGSFYRRSEERFFLSPLKYISISSGGPLGCLSRGVHPKLFLPDFNFAAYYEKFFALRT